VSQSDFAHGSRHRNSREHADHVARGPPSGEITAVGARTDGVDDLAGDPSDRGRPAKTPVASSPDVCFPTTTGRMRSTESTRRRWRSRTPPSAQQRACRRPAPDASSWAIPQATNYLARSRSGRPLFGEALVPEAWCGPWRRPQCRRSGLDACFHAGACVRSGRSRRSDAWQSASPRRPWQTPPGASSRAAGQLTLIRSAVAGSAANQQSRASRCRADGVIEMHQERQRVQSPRSWPL
jgi:hypothetical protein